MTAAVMDTEQRRAAGLIGHDSDGHEHDGSHNAPSMLLTDRVVGVAVSADLIRQAADTMAARAMRTVAAGPEVIVGPGRGADVDVANLADGRRVSLPVRIELAADIAPVADTRPANRAGAVGGAA